MAAALNVDGPLVAIVAALDEAAAIEGCLALIVGEADRTIVVDGGSTDETPVLASACGARVLVAPRGRASQMNAGALAAGEARALVFVHADTRLPSDWRAVVDAALASGARWGRFDVRLDSRRASLRLIGFMMNWRSRLTGICTGDQAIFVRGDAWRACGGFAPIALMEDVELSIRLKRQAGRPACPRARVTVSARRWERRGMLRTIALMWALRALYFLGASPQALHRAYYGRRG